MFSKLKGMLFFDLKKEVEPIKSVLEEMKKKLPTFQESRDPYQDIVDFFVYIASCKMNYVSEVIAELESKKPDHKIIGQLKKFEKEVRDEEKNRTKNGEEPTAHTVFIGYAKHSIEERSISIWKTEVDEKRKTSLENETRRFLDYKIKRILNLILNIQKIINS